MGVESGGSAKIADQVGKAPTAGALVYSLVEGLALHRDMERVAKANRGAGDVYNRTPSAERVWRDARVSPLDYSLARGVTAGLSLAYGKVKDLVPTDAALTALPSAGGYQAAVTDGIIAWVLGAVGPIRQDCGRDLRLVNIAAGHKGVGPTPFPNVQAQAVAFVNGIAPAN